MAKDYVMPKLAMAMNEGTITEWLIPEGGKVEQGQPIMTVETEKVSYDCESPATGYLHQLFANGDTIPCDELIAYICETESELAELGGAAPTAAVSAPVAGDTVVPAVAPAIAPVAMAAAPVRAPGERINASPLARKLAKNNGLDLALITGKGPGGRIVKRDIEAALISGVAAPQVAAPVVAAGGMVEKARVPMTGMRKVIATRMKQSFQDAAQLSSSWDSDITDLLAMRKKFVAREEALGTKVSMNAFIIKAIATAVKQVPIANSCLIDGEVVIYETINMGFAISVPGVSEYDKGLMVGVIRNVETMGVVEIDKAMKSLVERVREGKATPDDLSGSTITLSSTAGVSVPGAKSTPVLNLPNAALVGTATPIKKPVVIGDDIVVRTMMPLSMTFDHCMFDGEPAARFGKALHEALENPELMLA